jgi:hypothetical protein
MLISETASTNKFQGDLFRFLSAVTRLANDRLWHAYWLRPCKRINRKPASIWRHMAQNETAIDLVSKQSALQRRLRSASP